MGFFQTSGILNRRGFFGGAAKAFSPTDIAGLQLWLDATTGLFDATSGGSAVTTDGSAVARWEDQSGNGNHVTQTTLNNRPVLKTSIQNSKNIIRFDGTNDYFGRSKITLTKCTIFIAMSSTKNDIRQIFIQWGSVGPSDNQIHFWINSARYRCFFRDSAGTEKQVSQTSDKTSNFVALGTLFDSTAAFYVGDVTNGTDTFNGTLNSTNSHLGIGVKLDSGGSPADPAYLDGDIGEIIVFDSALSADNRTKIFDYLKTKWGL